jgi:hypothetical protein
MLGLEKPDFRNRRSLTCGEGAAGGYLPDRAGLKPRQAIVRRTQITCRMSHIDALCPAFQAASEIRFLSAGQRPAIMKITPFGLFH